MTIAAVGSVFHECGFCGFRGVLDVTLFDRDGWYFCGPCLAEVEYELKKRKAERILG